MNKRSIGEETLALHIRINGLPKPEREYKFHLTRKFRADFCFIDHMLIVEVDGGTWGKGGHSSGTGIERDYERDAEAMLLGYRVLRFTTNQVNTLYAIKTIQKILES